MSCNECVDKKCLASGKPCKQVEQTLWGRYRIRNADWIRPRAIKGVRGSWQEIPFSTLKHEPIGEDND